VSLSGAVLGCVVLDFCNRSGPPLDQDKQLGSQCGGDAMCWRTAVANSIGL
jgi:hypothetical protein